MPSKAKTAPYLAIKTDFRKDDRFEVLGNIAGYNKYEALGRMSHLWAWCRDRKLQDAPADADSYVVSEGVVVLFLGEHGIKAILAADVDCLALGQRRPDGSILLRGTSETVAALRQRLAASSAGGNARSAAPRVAGRYATSSRDGAENQPTGWLTPAETVPNTSLIRPPTSDHQEEVEIVSGKPDELDLGLPMSDPVRVFADIAVREINRLSGSKYESTSKAVLRLCKTLVRAKHTPEQAKQVIESKREWIGDAKMASYFRPATLLAESNFANYLDDAKAKTPRIQVIVANSNADDDEPDLSYAAFGTVHQA